MRKSHSGKCDAKFKPPATVVRKVLMDFAREAGKGSSSYQIQKAFDEDAGFVVDLAVTCAASYAKKPRSAILTNAML